MLYNVPLYLQVRTPALLPKGGFFKVFFEQSSSQVSTLDSMILLEPNRYRAYFMHILVVLDSRSKLIVITQAFMSVDMSDLLGCYGSY